MWENIGAVYRGKGVAKWVRDREDRPFSTGRHEERGCCQLQLWHEKMAAPVKCGISRKNKNTYSKSQLVSPNEIIGGCVLHVLPPKFTPMTMANFLVSFA